MDKDVYEHLVEMERRLLDRLDSAADHLDELHRILNSIVEEQLRQSSRVLDHERRLRDLERWRDDQEDPPDGGS